MRPQIRLDDGEHWVIFDPDDPEQALFTGTHRQCEDWLDQFEIQQQHAAQAQTVPAGASRDLPARGLFAWLKALLCGPAEATGKPPSSPRG